MRAFPSPRSGNTLGREAGWSLLEVAWAVVLLSLGLAWLGMALAEGVRRRRAGEEDAPVAERLALLLAARVSPGALPGTAGESRLASGPALVWVADRSGTRLLSTGADPQQPRVLVNPGAEAEVSPAASERPGLADGERYFLLRLISGGSPASAGLSAQSQSYPARIEVRWPHRLPPAHLPSTPALSWDDPAWAGRAVRPEEQRCLQFPALLRP